MKKDEIYISDFKKIAVIKLFYVLDNKLLEAAKQSISKNNDEILNIENFKIVAPKLRKLQAKELNKKFPYLNEEADDKIGQQNFLLHQYVFTAYANLRYRNLTIDEAVKSTLLDLKILLLSIHRNLVESDNLKGYLEEDTFCINIYLFIKFLLDTGLKFREHGKLKATFESLSLTIKNSDLSEQAFKSIREERKKFSRIRFN
ncbi:hypothetical protein HYY72_04160 [Candidatus Woesearchaeota archaeon]|nr:hypothetical protein [Candidatus Woesearchaeota archaeon]